MRVRYYSGSGSGSRLVITLSHCSEKGVLYNSRSNFRFFHLGISRVSITASLLLTLLIRISFNRMRSSAERTRSGAYCCITVYLDTCSMESVAGALSDWAHAQGYANHKPQTRVFNTPFFIVIFDSERTKIGNQQHIMPCILMHYTPFDDKFLQFI